MFKLKTVVLATLGLGSLSAIAQKGDWALAPYASHSMMFGDTDFDHPTTFFSPGAGFQLQYNYTDHLRVVGDLAYLSANGGGSVYYFEHQSLQALIGIDWDVLGEFKDNSKLGIHVVASIGGSLFQTEAYDATTNLSIARVPNEGAYSMATLASLGANVSYPIHNQIDIFAGYRSTGYLWNDWADGRSSGESPDVLGQFSLGLRFALNGRVPMAKVSQSDYDELVAAKVEAERQKTEAEDELEVSRQRYETQIEDLYNVLSVMNNNIDSLNQKITVLRSTPGSSTEYTVQSKTGGASTPNAEGSMWRLVVGSFPNLEMANEFAAQQVVGGGDYEVVFIEDLKTYRVVYKSYASLNNAKADLQKVKEVIANAWIIRF